MNPEELRELGIEVSEDVRTDKKDTASEIVLEYIMKEKESEVNE